MEETKENFIKTFNEHSDAIFRFCLLRVSDRELAKDLAQSAFTKTWDYILKHGELDNPKAFLYKVARNLLIDHYREARSESLENLYEAGLIDPRAPEDAFPAEEKADAKLALDLLQELSPDYREVVTLRFVEGLSFKEIAEITKETESAVTVRCHRAIKQMRNLFESKKN